MQPKWDDKGCSSPCGPPELHRPVLVSENKSFSSQPEATVSIFPISKQLFRWWLIPPALLQGAALILHCTSVHTPYNEIEMPMQKVEFVINDFQMFLNICLHHRNTVIWWLHAYFLKKFAENVNLCGNKDKYAQHTTHLTWI